MLIGFVYCYVRILSSSYMGGYFAVQGHLSAFAYMDLNDVFEYIVTGDFLLYSLLVCFAKLNITFNYILFILFLSQHLSIYIYMRILQNMAGIFLEKQLLYCFSDLFFINIILLLCRFWFEKWFGREFLRNVFVFISYQKTEVHSLLVFVLFGYYSFFNAFNSVDMVFSQLTAIRMHIKLTLILAILISLSVSQLLSHIDMFSDLFFYEKLLAYTDEDWYLLQYPPLYRFIFISQYFLAYPLLLIFFRKEKYVAILLLQSYWLVCLLWYGIFLRRMGASYDLP